MSACHASGMNEMARDSLVWTQMSLSPPQMSCWSSSGGVRDDGKSRKRRAQILTQNGNQKTAWAAQGGLGHPIQEAEPFWAVSRISAWLAPGNGSAERLSAQSRAGGNTISTPIFRSYLLSLLPQYFCLLLQLIFPS
jgi:hypothetical protein